MAANHYFCDRRTSAESVRYRRGKPPAGAMAKRLRADRQPTLLLEESRFDLGDPLPGEPQLGVGSEVAAKVPVAPPETAFFSLGARGTDPAAARHDVAVDACAELAEVDAHPGSLGEHLGHLHLLDDGGRSARVGVGRLAVVPLEEVVPFWESVGRGY